MPTFNGLTLFIILSFLLVINYLSKKRAKKDHVVYITHEVRGRKL
jgi:hypothetical protein